MTSTTGPTPAGWYTDPGGSGHLRWWDGNVWTAHLAPQPTPAPTPVVQPPAAQPVVVQPLVAQPVVAQPAVAQPQELPPVQESWQPDAQPYVPFQNSWATTAQPGPAGAGFVGEYAGPTSWNTPWAWILAASPIYFVALSTISGFLIAGRRSTASLLVSSPGEVGVGAGILVGLVLLVVFALLDNLRLKKMGYSRTAGWGWVFLTPLVYLIIRTVRVFGETRRGIAPLIFHVVVGIVAFVVYVVASTLLAASLLGGGGSFSTSGQFTAGLVKGLDQNGGKFTVSCPAIIPTTIGDKFSCTAIDTATTTSHVLSIEVVTGADGKPTVKLLSVTPPISK
jgi:hypothetical protein